MDGHTDTRIDRRQTELQQEHRFGQTRTERERAKRREKKRRAQCMRALAKLDGAVPNGKKRRGQESQPGVAAAST